jgi:segregation and condensation protein A
LSDYRVNLDIFAGPMDLLLYLIRKEEVDIYDIPIFKITEQYLRYIEMLKQFDIDLAGDFLVMASTLMQIKSAMLLPAADPEHVTSDDLSDPRTELIRQLLEYKKFKDAANLLDDAVNDQLMRYPRPDTIIEKLKPNTEPELDLDQVSIWDLLEAFDTIMAATGGGAAVDVKHIIDDTPIDLYQIEILHRLQTEGPMSFSDIFASRNNRLVMIGLFLAMLELIRDKLIWVEQSKPLAPIYLKALTDEPAEQAVQKAIRASENEIENRQSQQQQTPVSGIENSKEDQTQQKAAIAVVELSSKAENKPEISADTEPEQTIPIVELPAKGKIAASAEPERQETELT